ncbi:hypothetical protein OSTOST_01002, partial [Ostertagia ostertagi]
KDGKAIQTATASCRFATIKRPTLFWHKRSLRVPKKPKPLKPPVSKEPTVFLISQEPSSNLQVLQPIEENLPPPIFTPKPTQVIPCSLIQIFSKADAKPYEQDCRLTSFERKLRSHKKFGAGHQPHEKLLCPQQASQIEIRFTSTCSTDVIVQVQAPNGEFSSYLHPFRDHSVAFTPTKVGCGHGLWRIYVAMRVGCRFRHMRTIDIDLKGQGK